MSYSEISHFSAELCTIVRNRLDFRLALTVGDRVLLPVFAGQIEPGVRQRDLGRRPLNGGVHYQLIERVEAEKPLVNGYPVLGSRESHLGRVVHHATCGPPDQFDCPINMLYNLGESETYTR